MWLCVEVSPPRLTGRHTGDGPDAVQGAVCSSCLRGSARTSGGEFRGELLDPAAGGVLHTEVALAFQRQRCWAPGSRESGSGPGQCQLQEGQPHRHFRRVLVTWLRVAGCAWARRKRWEPRPAAFTAAPAPRTLVPLGGAVRPHSPQNAEARKAGQGCSLCQAVRCAAGTRVPLKECHRSP